MTAPTRAVIVDDSPFVRRLLASYLTHEAGFEIVGTAENGRDAVDVVCSTEPDVITLDLEMPVADGLEAIGHIMARRPTPIVVMTGVSRSAADLTLEAIRLGAIDFVFKFTPQSEVPPNVLRDELISKLRTAATIRVVRSLRTLVPAVGMPSRPAQRPLPLPSTRRTESRPRHGLHDDAARAHDVIVIGASTGGPMAATELLQQLPVDLSAAIVFVQHMLPEFTRVLAAQLQRQIDLPVHHAEHDDILLPGHVYVAAGDRHLMIRPDLTLELTEGPAVAGHRPSIDVTMQSAAHARVQQLSGVLMTGMGDDGVAGLSCLRRKGFTTFAQKPSSCVVAGMPEQAIRGGAVDWIGTPREIGQQLARDYLNHSTADPRICSRAASALEYHQQPVGGLR